MGMPAPTKPQGLLTDKTTLNTSLQWCPVSSGCSSRYVLHPSPRCFVRQQTDLYILHCLGFLVYHWVQPVGCNGRRLKTIDKQGHGICFSSHTCSGSLVGSVSLPLPKMMAPVWQPCLLPTDLVIASSLCHPWWDSKSFMFHYCLAALRHAHAFENGLFMKLSINTLFDVSYVSCQDSD